MKVVRMVAKKFCFPHCENSTTNALSRHDLHLFVIDEHYSECSTCAGGILSKIAQRNCPKLSGPVENNYWLVKS